MTATPDPVVAELIERLTDEIEFQGDCFQAKSPYPGCPGLLEQAAAQLAALSEWVAELEGALKPFADACTASEPYRDFDGRDYREVYVVNAVGLDDFEGARAALTGKK